MPQSVLSLMKIQTSASAEGEGNGSTFPFRDVSHVPAQTAPSPIPPGPSGLSGADASLSLQRFQPRALCGGYMLVHSASQDFS